MKVGLLPVGLVKVESDLYVFVKVGIHDELHEGEIIELEATAVMVAGESGINTRKLTATISAEIARRLLTAFTQSQLGQTTPCSYV